MSEGGESTSPRLLAAPLQVTVLAVWVCALRRDVSGYHRVLELLQTLSTAAPGLVSYRHLAKLQLGLKAKMILEMFRKGCRLADIRTRLGHLFPLEDPPQSSEATVADSQKVRGIEQQFRELVLYLLRDPSFRTSFLQDEGQSHYGEVFMAALDKLLWELLLRVGEAQDPPRLQPCRADVELPVVGALSQLPASCFQLLLSNMGSTHSLYPGTPLVLDPSPPGKGADSPEGGEVEAGGGVVDGHLPRPQMPCRRTPGKKMKSRRSLRGRRGRSALPPPSRRQYPRATKKENKESGCGCLSRLDVPEIGDEPDTEFRETPATLPEDQAQHTDPHSARAPWPPSRAPPGWAAEPRSELMVCRLSLHLDPGHGLLPSDS
ncbi:uncharacterized protein LOC132381850 isoform X3 [Hypanus sabinus]|uniref:uncharacterized protein LOC132381850 isoform X3 n=1 Tax=Hypanus sabinus TaxID=79690 RepID=UPI0028C4E776|nr:uncharacterized protein LOC132381850 isoform X3 [Hypanus sabinus]